MITPREVYVFTVDSTSSLVSVPVELGTLLGEEVEIKTGLSPDMQIVKDARGLKPGDVVTINQ
jgi:multidrug efflux pump subunit AcrA (membrane-fusion protein)